MTSSAPCRCRPRSRRGSRPSSISSMSSACFTSASGTARAASAGACRAGLAMTERDAHERSGPRRRGQGLSGALVAAQAGGEAAGAKPEGPAAEPEIPPAPVAEAEAVPEFDLSSLPKLEEMTGATDITGFLKKGVPEHLRNAALQKSWALDPAIRNYVNPALEYAYDWNTPGGVPGSSETRRRPGRGADGVADHGRRTGGRTFHRCRQAGKRTRRSRAKARSCRRACARSGVARGSAEAECRPRCFGDPNRQHRSSSGGRVARCTATSGATPWLGKTV